MLTGTIAEHVLLYYLPITSSYTGGTLDTSIFLCIPAIRKRRKQTETADRTTCRTLDTMPETETADQNRQATAKQPEHINHSGIIGNAIPGSENQQNPSDHDKLMTSDASCHNFQTILIFCTANFRITEKPKKRYIIRTYTQGSAPAVQEISGNSLTITANVLTETVFRFWRQFLKNVERDFCSVILRKFSIYMRSVPIVPTFARIFIYGSHQKRLASYRQVIGKLP